MRLVQTALLALLGIATSVTVLPAQRASMQVSATVLPSQAELASGVVAPTAATGNLMVASARLESVSSVKAARRSVSRTSSQTSHGLTELTLGIAVSANVHSALTVLGAASDSLARVIPSDGRSSAAASMAKRSSGSVVPVTYAVPPTRSATAPTPVVVVITVGSIA